MKCVVTGGLGFIGSHLVDLLVRHGMEVAVVDNLATGQGANLNPSATLYRIDVRDLDALKQISSGAEFFFHMAALPRIQPSFDHPKQHEEVNVIGTIRCLQAAINNSIRKFVFSSSSAIYGNAPNLPTPESTPPNLLNPYALQKFTAEQYCFILGRRFGIPVVSLRYFNVYGPRSFNPQNPQNAYSSVVGIFTQKRLEGNPLMITGDGQQTRDFVHVEDVAKANLAAAYSGRSMEPYNVGSGIGTTVNQVAKIIGGEVTYIPERTGETRHTMADIKKIEREIGWSPKISLEQGIIRLMQETN